MALIPLYQGRGDATHIAGYAAVDDSDMPLVSQYKWRLFSLTSTLKYARRGGGSTPTTYMHDVVMGVNRGVDHRDRNGLNNRRSNLRLASHAQNMQNRKVRSDSISGVRGVRYDGRYWRAGVKVAGKAVWEKRFDTLEKAAVAVRQARAQLFSHAID